MAKERVAPSIASLLKKGEGVLTKRNGVWTYPGAPNDQSGTNLKMPAESVSDAAVQDAIAKGDLVVRATDMMGGVLSVGAPPEDGSDVKIVNIAQAGTVEFGTEIPRGSRPTHDAGRRIGTVDVAVAQGKDDKGPQPSGPIAPAGSGSISPQKADEPLVTS